MRITRIELDGDAGHLAIQRERGSGTIRIASILPDPKRGQQVWKTWELPAGVTDEELFKVAIEVQFRTDGGTGTGTNSEIGDYFREMQRFQD